jgi:hypothetical protein
VLGNMVVEFRREVAARLAKGTFRPNEGGRRATHVNTGVARPRTHSQYHPPPSQASIDPSLAQPIPLRRHHSISASISSPSSSDSRLISTRSR